jgi:hypothetical protein
LIVAHDPGVCAPGHPDGANPPGSSSAATDDDSAVDHGGPGDGVPATTNDDRHHPPEAAWLARLLPPRAGPVLASLDSGCGRPNDYQRKQVLKVRRTRSTQVKSLRFEGIAGSLHCMIIEASDPQVEDLTVGSGARR